MTARFHQHGGGPTRSTWASKARTAVVAAFVATTVGILGWPPMAGADGTETLAPPSIPLAKGSGVATGGTGMHTQPATMTVTVPAGATVKQVLLYWEGHYTTGEPDSTIAVEGTTVQGTLIGGPKLFFEDKLAATYRADITSLNVVSAGTNTLDVSGLEFSFRNNGAGVLVIYDDGTETVIDLRDGQDLAYFEFAPPLDTTVPQTFTFATSPTAREATLDLFAASVADSGKRPNALDVTIAGDTTRFVDVFSSSAGPEFDVVRRTITVPAGATQMTVQALSVGDGTTNKPASFDWIATALSLRPPPAGPGATASLACPEGLARIRLTNTGGSSTTFDVFRGQEKLNAGPVAVAAGATTTFDYALRPADENTTVPLRAVAATGAEFDLATPVDCSRPGPVVALGEDCATQNGVKGILVRLTNEGTERATFTVPGRDPVTVNPKSSTDVFLAVPEGEAYSFDITGAGGFKRTISGTRECQAPQLAPLQICAEQGTGTGVLVAVTNSGEEAVPVTLGSETKTAPAGGRAEFFVKRSEGDPATTLSATAPGNAPLQVALPVQDCVPTGVGPGPEFTPPTDDPSTPPTFRPPESGPELPRTGFGLATVLRIGLLLLSAGALMVRAGSRQGVGRLIDGRPQARVLPVRGVASPAGPKGTAGRGLWARRRPDHLGGVVDEEPSHLPDVAAAPVLRFASDERMLVPVLRSPGGDPPQPVCDQEDRSETTQEERGSEHSVLTAARRSGSGSSA